MKAGFTDTGASITDIIVPDRNGNFENVVLKHNDPGQYKINEPYLGATIGRYANRIAGGNIGLNGKTYQLSVNEKSANNHLHGGNEGFSRKTWDVKTSDSNSITFEYTSYDGEEGYPGNLVTTVQYKLDENNCLSVQYKAVTDKPTIVNLTNHSYFNLSGGKENIFNHILTIEASEYTPLNEQNLPEGYVAPVKNTIYDLQSERLVADIADTIINTNYCIDNSKGLTKTAVLAHPISGRKLTVDTIINTNYCIDNIKGLTKTAVLAHPISGRKLTVYATMPGLQLYFGNFLSGSHNPYDGICLEPQYYPDAPNIPAFNYKWLQKGEFYEETIVYHFEVSAHQKVKVNRVAGKL